MIKITFPDGAVREYESGSTTFDIAQSISNSLAKKANPRVSGEVAACNACKSTNAHHALNTNVDNTGALGDDATKSTKNKRCFNAI